MATAPALALGEEPPVIANATSVEAPPAAPPDVVPEAQPGATPTSAAPAEAQPAATLDVDAVLPAKTVVLVMLDQDLTTADSHLGDAFPVTVVEDVMDQSTIVIPKGTVGSGEVTFVTNKGGFGKPGILGIALRYLDLGGKRVLLDGRYREEGKNNADAAAATWFAVGIFAGFVKGKAGQIPKGRQLKARTGEDIPFLRVSAPPPADIADAKPQEQPNVAPEGSVPPAIAQGQTAF